MFTHKRFPILAQSVFISGLSHGIFLLIPHCCFKWHSLITILTSSMATNWNCSPVPSFVNTHKAYLLDKGWHCQFKGSVKYCGKCHYDRGAMGEKCDRFIHICVSLKFGYGMLLCDWSVKQRNRCWEPTQLKWYSKHLVNHPYYTLLRYPPFIPHYKMLPTQKTSISDLQTCYSSLVIRLKTSLY